LYGTTQGESQYSNGSVFQLTLSEGVWKESAILFGPSDGTDLVSSVLISGGSIYGAAAEGGSPGFGTLYQIKDGAITVLHDFCSQTNCQDGAVPLASPLSIGGSLYGTTNEGGLYGHGVFYEYTP
jgi:uncharacterized repeat protein (TIGR03803 family)